MRDRLVQIDESIWELPKDSFPEMRVPARIFATNEMLDLVEKDKSLVQLRNVATLPGIVSNALVMPDVHEGYGFPIGAVAAIDMDNGIISPGGIGYDINCGIRVLTSAYHKNELSRKIPEIAKEINNNVPSGVGRSGKLRLSPKETNEVLELGCKWLAQKGISDSLDLEFIESYGSLVAANPDAVSKQAKDRGYDQLGTLGAGNHFLEIDYISHILDEEVANTFGLFENQVVIQVHTGSRGLGHQVATDYVKSMQSAAKKYGFELPDRELCCAPFNSEEGKNYFAAMCASANFAWANRQMISEQIRKAWKTVLGTSRGNLNLLYDVAHNIAKIEDHKIGNSTKKVIVHRKGATRAFPALHKEIPDKYKNVGQPVLIPGSMGTSSYILVGLSSNMEISFGSCCHGSGRVMSRTAARKSVQGNELKEELNKKGIQILTASLKGLAEEAPSAYKDVNQVVDVVSKVGIAKQVARLKPLAVIKG